MTEEQYMGEVNKKYKYLDRCVPVHIPNYKVQPNGESLARRCAGAKNHSEYGSNNFLRFNR